MKEQLIKLLLWLIARVSNKKDKRLAFELHELADGYDPRPKGNGFYYLLVFGNQDYADDTVNSLVAHRNRNAETTQ